MPVMQMLMGGSVPLSATSTGAAVYNKIGGLRPDTGFTTTVNIVPTGGTGTYTYSWARLSGDTRPTISNATASSVNWTATATLNTDSANAVWRCTVSDGAGTVTVDVPVNFTWEA